MAAMWNSSSRSKQYLIKHHNPRRTLAVRTIFVLAIFAAFWGLYEFGRGRSGYDWAKANNQIRALRDQISELDSRIDKLMIENAQLASDKAIDSTANLQVSDKLRQLNEEMFELKEELVFYRSLLSPAEMEPGLQILGIQMSKDGNGNTYNYKIVLTQRHSRDQFATGEISMQLNGVDAGKKMRLDLQQLISEGDHSLAFKFKNFQSLEGQLKLPDGFEPKDVLVSILPATRGIKQIERTYEWNSIASGG
jgi:cell division protein FtsB